MKVGVCSSGSAALVSPGECLGVGDGSCGKLMSLGCSVGSRCSTCCLGELALSDGDESWDC